MLEYTCILSTSSLAYINSHIVDISGLLSLISIITSVESYLLITRLQLNVLLIVSFGAYCVLSLFIFQHVFLYAL